MKSLLDSRALDAPKDILRALRRAYFPVQDAVTALYARSFRRGSFVREILAGDDPLRGSAQAAVYVHYDKDGLIHDYVLHQLSELVSAGFRITFVSNSPVFPNESRARIVPLCKELIWRLNVGYDFGAYKDGLASIEGLDQLATLVLMNDSVYGPFWSLRETLEKIDRTTTDFWGIADSFEYQHHIQTFLMVFLPTTIRSAAFTSFWNNLPHVTHKRWVIRNAEVKLTGILMRAGLRLSVLAPYWSVAAKMKSEMPTLDAWALRDGKPEGFQTYRSRVTADRSVNPMQYFWDVLIEDFQCPFIKRELIQSNPARIPFVSRWPEVIAARSNYNIEMITRHLKK